MIEININPILLQIGPIAIRWYGLMYVVGISVGVWVATSYAKIRGITEDQIWYVFWPAVIAGLLGARLYYVAQSDPLSYLSQPWRILATWEGGMAFYGAVFGAALAIFFACRRAHIDIPRFLDVGAIFAVVGQAFGRIGNIINGDIVGYPTDQTWGFVYVHPNSFVPERGVAYQPAALYELASNAIIFGILWSLRHRLRRPGTMFLTWLVLYSISQIIIFTQRMNVILYFGLKQAQLTAIVVLIACIPFYLFIRSRPWSPDEDEEQRDEDVEREADDADSLDAEARSEPGSAGV